MSVMTRLALRLFRPLRRDRRIALAASAMGADGRSLRALVLREAMVLLAIGLTVGLSGVVVLGRALSEVLYDVHTADPPSLVLVVLVLSVTAVFAGWIPARRAARVPPMEALRDR